jgi:hypothetical protein
VFLDFGERKIDSDSADCGVSFWQKLMAIPMPSTGHMRLSSRGRGVERVEREMGNLSTESAEWYDP